MHKNYLRLIQLVLSLCLLALVAWHVGLFDVTGRREFLALFANADITFICLSVIVGLLVNMSSALKWWMLVRAQELLAGYWRVFSYYLIGQFYNLFLPTSVGGDVVRSYQLGKHTGRQADALASVFIERYTGVVVLLVISGVAVISRLSVFSDSLVLWSLVFFVIAIGFIAWVVFDARVYQWLSYRFANSSSFLSRVLSKINTILVSIDAYKHQPKVIVVALINSILFYFLAVLNVYVTALVFTSDVVFVDILIATPIIMLIMNLPISMGNIGLMESGYSGIFYLMGYSPALGLSVALLMRVKSLIDGAMGGILQSFFISGSAVPQSVLRD